MAQAQTSAPPPADQRPSSHQNLSQAHDGRKGGQRPDHPDGHLRQIGQRVEQDHRERRIGERVSIGCMEAVERFPAPNRLGRAPVHAEISQSIGDRTQKDQDRRGSG
jgi:hypothetical protein